MNPRIRKVNGLWMCSDLQPWKRIGIGYTPAQAYSDWKAQK